MDRGGWQATDHGVAKRQPQLRSLSTYTHLYICKNPKGIRGSTGGLHDFQVLITFSCCLAFCKAVLMLQFIIVLKSEFCFPGSSAGKEAACNEGDPNLIPGLGRSPGEGNNYPLQYSGLENSMLSQRVGHD